MAKLDSEWIEEEFEENEIDPYTGEFVKDKNGKFITRTQTYTDMAQEREREYLQYEIDIQKLMNKIEQTIVKACEIKGYTKAHELIRIYENFVDNISKEEDNKESDEYDNMQRAGQEFKQVLGLSDEDVYNLLK